MYDPTLQDGEHGILRQCTNGMITRDVIGATKVSIGGLLLSQYKVKD